MSITKFDQVVAPLGSGVFLKDYWLKKPIHIPGTPGCFAHFLTWSGLNAILEQHRLTPPRLKLYRDGQPVDPSHYLTPAMFGVPRLNAGGLAASLAQGASLILDDVQEMAPQLRNLLTSFQEALHTDAYANLYAGWHRQKAFNVHWDPQEAIVLQLSGRKHWKVYAPTRLHPIKNDIEAPQPPSTPPAWEGILNDGDMLYIPRGWWHEAFPLDEPSLHVTVSLTPPTSFDYLAWALARLRSHDELRASLVPGQNAHMTRSISKLLDGLPKEAPLAEFLSEWEANIRPAPYVQLPEAPYSQLSTITASDRVRLTSQNRLSFYTVGEKLAFTAAGRQWAVPSALRPALARLQNNADVSVSELAAMLPSASAQNDLLKSLSVLAQAGVILLSKG